MIGKAFKWAVVAGTLFALTNLGYYGYRAVTVDGYGSNSTPLSSTGTITVETGGSAPQPIAAQGAPIRLAVPFTPQAPLGDWARHQESCEEANLAQLAAYYSGNHSEALDRYAADRTINQLVAWQVKNWGSEDDLTDVRLGKLAEAYYGYQYEVLPMTDAGLRAQLAAGRPVIIGVTTHALGNPAYPNYELHYLQIGYSVSHFITIVGVDGSGYIVNDPGLTAGRGYHVGYGRLVFAIQNLDQLHPALDEGQVMLVIHPRG